MKQFANLIFEYRYIIIYALVLIVGIIFNPSEFKARLYQAILQAKKLAKDGVLQTGIAQEDYVVANISKFVGFRFKFILTLIGENNLRLIIKKLYIKAIDLVDDGKLNDSVK